MNDLFQQAMRISSHSDMSDVWLRAKEGGQLEGEEAMLACMMQEHMEYHDIWNRLDEYGGNEIVVNGVSPILHVNTHAIVETQIEQNSPPEVQPALAQLLKRGASRHDAIHAIAYELFMEIRKTLSTSRPFNHIAYKRRLEKLAGRKRF
jgi:hypothetical protein